mgnify:CR=1 FL=1
MSPNTHSFMQNTHEFAVRGAFSRRNKNAPNSSVPAADLFPDGLRHVLLKRRPVLWVYPDKEFIPYPRLPGILITSNSMDLEKLQAKFFQDFTGKNSPVSPTLGPLMPVASVARESLS